MPPLLPFKSSLLRRLSRTCQSTTTSGAAIAVDRALAPGAYCRSHPHAHLGRCPPSFSPRARCPPLIPALNAGPNIAPTSAAADPPSRLLLSSLTREREQQRPGFGSHRRTLSRFARFLSRLSASRWRRSERLGAAAMAVLRGSLRRQQQDAVVVSGDGIRERRAQRQGRGARSLPPDGATMKGRRARSLATERALEQSDRPATLLPVLHIRFPHDGGRSALHKCVMVRSKMSILQAEGCDL